MAVKRSLWDMILKVVIAVASAVLGVVGGNATVSYTHLTLPTTPYV